MPFCDPQNRLLRPSTCRFQNPNSPVSRVPTGFAAIFVPAALSGCRRVSPLFIPARSARAREYATGSVPVCTRCVLIAGQALCEGLTVVTDNIEHFGRIEGLNIENWMERWFVTSSAQGDCPPVHIAPPKKLCFPLKKVEKTITKENETCANLYMCACL